MALTVGIDDCNQQRCFSRSPPAKNAMNTMTLLLGACALAALSVGTAGAGPCTAEIDNVGLQGRRRRADGRRGERDHGSAPSERDDFQKADPRQ